MKYAYCRVSTQDQPGSLEAQTNLMIKEGIMRQNIFTDDGRSGGITDDDFEIVNDTKHYGMVINKNKRPAFGKLLQIVKPNDEIIFTVWSRFSRNLLMQELIVMNLTKQSIKLKPLQDTEHPFARKVMGMANEQFLEDLKKNIHRVKNDQYEKGIHPSKAPYGYDKNTTDKKTGRLKHPSQPEGLIINKQQSETVKKIFQMKLEGQDFKTICQTLKIPSSLYYLIIKNKIYTGIIKYQGQSKKGNHEPIISKEDFEKAQGL